MNPQLINLMVKNEYGMDPTALERAAKAVRELNQSPHAKQALQSQIKWAEQKKESYIVQQKQKDIEKKEKEIETRQKLKEIEVEQYKEKQDYADKMERKRQKDMADFSYEEEEKRQNMIEEKLIRQENVRKSNIDYEYKKKEQLMEKEYTLQGKKEIQIKKETFDIDTKHMQTQAQERRQTLKELFTMGQGFLSNGLNYLKDHKMASLTIGVYLGCATFGIYGAKNLANAGYQVFLNKYMRPSLIRETSRFGLKNLKVYANTWLRRETHMFSETVFDKDLQTQLSILSHAIVNRKTNVAPLRNVCFYGPPGTGKTLFAKKLSYYSGMDYAIFSGSDVIPLGSSGVQEINKVFDWAGSNPRGTILFIDEADALFRKRETNMSENLRNAINCFLNRTGTPSHRFMLVLATNQPSQLDHALIDRIDQYLPFDLPNLEQREDLLQLYLRKYGSQRTVGEQLQLLWLAPFSLFRKIHQVENQIKEGEIGEFVEKLEGFSCREIEKFVIYCHDKALNEGRHMDREILHMCLDRYLRQHEVKLQWI